MEHAKKRPFWLICLVSAAIALAVGMLAVLLTKDGMMAYEQLAKPALAPPKLVFPIAWTILYLLMGVSAALVYVSGSARARDALSVYFLQLFLNFGWTILFFGFHLLFAAFIWLVVLLGVVIVMLASFWSVRPLAGALQIPYALWLAFAAYLNFATFLLNG